MDCTVWNEHHRTRLAFRPPGAGVHRDIEQGKVPSAARGACIARSACTSLDQNSNKKTFQNSVVPWVGTSIYYRCKSFPVLLYDVMVGGWIAWYVFIFLFGSRCCCCCMLLLLSTTSILKWREVTVTLSSFSLSAASTAVSFASILLLLLLLRRFMHLYFLVELLLLLIDFLVGCAAAAADACAAYNISTEEVRGTGYCFFLQLFCPLHCDASHVYCCCCSWLLIFLSFRLRCFGYGC